MNEMFFGLLSLSVLHQLHKLIISSLGKPQPIFEPTWIAWSLCLVAHEEACGIVSRYTDTHFDIYFERVIYWNTGFFTPTSQANYILSWEITVNIWAYMDCLIPLFSSSWRSLWYCITLYWYTFWYLFWKGDLLKYRFFYTDFTS